MTANALPYDDIVWACTNLCELLEVENEALGHHDVQTVKDLADNKAALARIYEQSVLPMAEDPSLADSLEPEQKEELTELGRRLQQLVEANARILQAEMEACQMVMDSVVHAVKHGSSNAMAYGKAGTFDGHKGPEFNSVSINKTL